MAGPFGGLLAPGKPGAAGPPPPGPMPEGEGEAAEEAGEHREQLLLVSDDFLAAVKAGDRDGIADAFEAAYAACSGGK